MILVAHAADVAVGRRQGPDQRVLGMARILILVHHQIPAVAAPFFRDLGVLIEKLQGEEDQVVEVHGVGGAEPLPVPRIDLAHRLRPGARVRGEETVGAHQEVSGVADGAQESSGREIPVVDFQLFLDVPHQRHLVGVVVDHEVLAIPQRFGVAPEDPESQGVEGGDPGAAARSPQQIRHAAAHFVGGLVGEGHGEDFVGEGFARSDQVGDPLDDHARLPRSGPRQDQERSFHGEDRLLLSRIEGVQGHRGSGRDRAGWRKR